MLDWRFQPSDGSHVAQVHVEKSAKAVRRQRAEAEKTAAQAHSDRLAAGSTQREPDANICLMSPLRGCILPLYHH